MLQFLRSVLDCCQEDDEDVAPYTTYQMIHNPIVCEMSYSVENRFRNLSKKKTSLLIAGYLRQLTAKPNDASGMIKDLYPTISPYIYNRIRYLCSNKNIPAASQSKESIEKKNFKLQDNGLSCQMIFTQMDISSNSLPFRKAIIVKAKQKHPILAGSFGLLGIKKDHIDDILSKCQEFISVYNVVGKYSNWLQLTEWISMAENNPFGISKEKFNKMEYIRLHVLKFPFSEMKPISATWPWEKGGTEWSFNVHVHMTSQVNDSRFGGRGKIKTGIYPYLKDGDALCLKIQKKENDEVWLYWSWTKYQIGQTKLDLSNYVYFPILGDTYNNIFEFEVSES